MYQKQHLVSILNGKNQYEFEWKDCIIYAGGDVIERNGSEFIVHLFIVPEDVYKGFLPISSMNKGQFDRLASKVIKAKTISLFRDGTK